MNIDKKKFLFDFLGFILFKKKVEVICDFKNNIYNMYVLKWIFIFNI